MLGLSRLSLPPATLWRRGGGGFFFRSICQRLGASCLIVFGNKLLVPVLGSPGAQNSCFESGRLVQVEFNGNLL